MKQILELLQPYIHRGRVKLKSGKFSDLYFDIKAAYGDPQLLGVFVHELARVIDRNATCVAGSGYGGLPLASAIALRLKLPLVMVRETKKSHGRTVWIDGYIPGVRDRVAIVDDIYTTGTGMRHIERVLKKTKAPIIGRYVVVDRSGSQGNGVTALIGVDALLLESEQ